MGAANMRVNTATRLKNVIKPQRPEHSGNIYVDIEQLAAYRRAIRRYYQARLSYGEPV